MLNFVKRWFKKDEQKIEPIDYEKIEEMINRAVEANLSELVKSVQAAIPEITGAIPEITEKLEVLEEIKAAFALISEGAPTPGDLATSEETLSDVRSAAAKKGVEARMQKKAMGMIEDFKDQLEMDVNPFGKVAMNLIPGLKDLVEGYPMIEQPVMNTLNNLIQQYLPQIMEKLPDNLKAAMMGKPQQQAARPTRQRSVTGFQL